jgi:uncharacterized protein YicC (UPF0701 family)
MTKREVEIAEAIARELGKQLRRDLVPQLERVHAALAVIQAGAEKLAKAQREARAEQLGPLTRSVDALGAAIRGRLAQQPRTRALRPTVH